MRGFIRETVSFDRFGKRTYYRTYFLDDNEVSKAEYDKARKYKVVIEYAHQTTVSRPSGDKYRNHHSDALMVCPDQRKEAEEYASKMGVPTSYNADGCPKINSVQHLRKLARAHGMRDRSGYI